MKRLRPVPRRSMRLVISPNQRSIWLSQGLLAGVNWAGTTRPRTFRATSRRRSFPQPHLVSRLSLLLVPERTFAPLLRLVLPWIRNTLVPKSVGPQNSASVLRTPAPNESRFFPSCTRSPAIPRTSAVSNHHVHMVAMRADRGKGSVPRNDAVECRGRNPGIHKRAPVPFPPPPYIAYFQISGGNP